MKVAYIALFIITLFAFTTFAQEQKVMGSCTTIDANKYDCFFDSASRQYLLSFCDGSQFLSTDDSFATKDLCVQSCSSTNKCLSQPSQTQPTTTTTINTSFPSTSCNEICSQKYASSSSASLKTVQDAQCSSAEPYSTDKYSGSSDLSYLWATASSPGVCQSGQCWCLISSKRLEQQQDISSLIPASGLGSASFPGTTGALGWDDPSAIQRPPAKKPNFHLCNVISNVSITGNIPDLVEANSQVTITGEVTKFSKTCDGIAYKCRPQTKVTCEVDNGLLETCVETKACPSSKPNKIYTQGESCDFNWGLVLAAVGLFTGNNNLAMIGILLQSQSGPDESQCFGICAKEYWTNEEEACVAQPTCNGPVIETKNCQYSCKEVSCGPFEGRTVDVQIKAKDGSTVQTYQATTNKDGQFSYTFTTPQEEGPYAVVASVVKDWENTNSTNSTR